VSRHAAGTIVLVDWRDALPKEANKRRPAIVVEDAELFDPAWPNVVLVPLTSDQRLAIPSLSVRIEPTPENGLDRPSWALAHAVTATSLRRVEENTLGRIGQEALEQIRRRIALTLGLV
jgi:mRNA-degrading endonuclease toxin of MazEF toxin-antitoxin module